MVKLYLLNDHSSLDLVASIIFSFTETQQRSLQADILTHVDQLTIKSYSKETDILSKARGNEEFTITGVSADDTEKLARFCGYLAERKKAAILSLPGKTDHIYLLPSATKSDKYTCIATFHFTKPVLPPSSTSATHAPSSSSPTSSSSTSSSSAASNNSFLGKLLNKSKTTQEVRNMPLNPIDEAKKQRMVMVDTLMRRLREQFLSFVDDESFLEFHLEPMEKETRYVAHEVADEFPQLLTASVGDDDNRHVLVYRSGHFPSDLPEDALSFTKGMTISKLPAQRSHAKTTNKVSLLEEMPEQMQQNLIKLNPVKRDRRTAAEVVEEIKRRKLG